jgi:hypothetical protein
MQSQERKDEMKSEDEAGLALEKAYQVAEQAFMARFSEAASKF